MIFQNKKVNFLIKLAISILILVFIFSKIEYKSFFNIIVRANWGLLILAILFGLIPYFFLTLRWKNFLNVLEINISLKKLYLINLLGVFYSLFLPGRISGDIVKGYKLINTNLQKKKKEIAVSVLVDRGIGMLSLIFIAIAVVLLNLEIRQKILINKNIFSLVIFIIAVLFAVIFSKSATKYLINQIKKVIPKKILNIQKLQKIYYSLIVYQDRKEVLLEGIIFSAIGLFGNIFVSYLVCLSLGINISYLNLIVIIAVTTIILILPISFSGLGVREGANVILMGYFGVAAEQALAFSVLSFAILVIFYSILGTIIELFFIEKIKAMK